MESISIKSLSRVNMTTTNVDLHETMSIIIGVLNNIKYWSMVDPLWRQCM